MLKYQRNWDNIHEKDMLKRCKNSKAIEFSSYQQMGFQNDRIANAIINGQKNYHIYIHLSFSSSKLNEKLLVINSNFEYLGIVKIISEEIIKFSDLKENMVDYKLAGFKIFEEYKNNLLKEFQEESKIYSAHFTEVSLINYVKLKVIKKL